MVKAYFSQYLSSTISMKLSITPRLTNYTPKMGKIGYNRELEIFLASQRVMLSIKGNGVTDIFHKKHRSKAFLGP